MKLKYIFVSIFVLWKITIYAESNSLQKLIKIAVANNPQLQSLRKEYISKKTEIMPAYIPPDPTISFNLMNIPVDTFAFDKSPMSSKQIAFKQMLPFPTKLIYKGKIKTREAEIKKLSYLLFKEKLKLNVRLKYYEITYIDKTIKTEKKKREQLETFEKIAEIKYKVGKGLQQDLLKARVRLAYITKKLIILETTKKNKIDELIKLIGVKNIPEKIKFLYHNLNIADKEKILAIAKENFLGLKLKEISYKKAEDMNSLAKWNFLPDIMIGAAYSIRDDNLPDKGTDFYTISVGLVFPLYFPFKQTPLVISSKQKEESVIQSLKDMENIITEKINIHFQLYEQNKEIFKLFKEEIIPESEISLDSALNAYQVDKVDFLNVLQSLINLYDSYIKMERTEAEIYKQSAYLKYYTNDLLK